MTVILKISMNVVHACDRKASEQDTEAPLIHSITPSIKHPASL